MYCRVRPASATELSNGHLDVHKVIEDNELTLMNDTKGRVQQVDDTLLHTALLFSLPCSI